MRPRDRKHRFTGSLAESYCCPTSANRAPRWVATRRYCVGPVLSVPDSSAPSPPGPSGSGLFAEGVQSRYWANESWSIFVCGAGFICGPGFADRSGSSATRRNQPRANDRRNDIHSENSGRKIQGRDLAQRGHCRAEHSARLFAAAVLDIDHRGIDALVGDILQRNGPASRAAVPVADLHEIAHDVVVGDLLTAILAAPDRDRHRARNRAEPDFATALLASTDTLICLPDNVIVTGTDITPSALPVVLMAPSMAARSLPITCA